MWAAVWSMVGYIGVFIFRFGFDALRPDSEGWIKIKGRKWWLIQSSQKVKGGGRWLLVKSGVVDSCTGRARMGDV